MRRNLSACLAAAACLCSPASAQTVQGSVAAELNIGVGTNGVTAQAALSGSAGVGIPLPSIALGIAPGEPVLLVNTDLNVVSVAGGAIESATGGVISSGAAQSVIRTGLSGGDVTQVIANQAASIVADAVAQSSGGFIPASATRTVLTAAIDGGDIRDALEQVLFDLIVDEALRLLAGQLGSAVQDLSGGFIDSNVIENLFNGVVNGGNPGDLFLQALQQQFGDQIQRLTGGVLSAAEINRLVNAALNGNALRQSLTDRATQFLIDQLGGQVSALTNGVIDPATLRQIIDTAFSNSSAQDLLNGTAFNRVSNLVGAEIERLTGGTVTQARAQQLINSAANNTLQQTLVNEGARLLAQQLGPQIQSLSGGVIDSATVERIIRNLLSGGNAGAILQANASSAQIIQAAVNSGIP